ncbi:nitronate monooxygenase [Deferribacteraceae bacterium V6Fe1]|nr:nitronate monooxygenase [Deferribacteraceae bacterium V6Fe1]
MNHLKIIQGGMGVGVSNWKLAKAVSLAGGLGVVSSTVLDNLMVRRLNKKDEATKRALLNFPLKNIADKILDKYYGKVSNIGGYSQVPFFSIDINQELIELTVAANFVEVYLAKEGHSNPIGINLLEKVQMPTLYSLYGAMLADVDYVIMGAGIPREIPGILDKFAQGLDAELNLYVTGVDSGDSYKMYFSPEKFMGKKLQLKRPFFFPIISSNILATTLLKKSNGKIDGLIIENHTAGGHNAPPRTKGVFADDGSPVYGDKDIVDFDKIKSLGVPFFLAGGYVTPEVIGKTFNEIGAAGIQVGTIFALTQESGFTEDIKLTIINKIKNNALKIYTDPLASPTGFPFKVAQIEGTLSVEDIYNERPRICNLRYLAELYKNEFGSIGYRCPAEPIEDYIKKGGNIEETKGRKCLCNALLANIGYGSTYKNGYKEPYLITLGDSATLISHLLPEEGLPSAKGVTEKLKSYIGNT